jgi:hypothetical protein
MTLRAILVVCLPFLAACRGNVIAEQGPDPWAGTDGVAAPLPPNGSSPEAWNGWWVRFPTTSTTVSAITTLGEDAILVGDGIAGELDLGSGLLAPDLPYSDPVQVLFRVSSAGTVTWARILEDAFAPVAVDATSRILLAGSHGLATYDASGQLVDTTSWGNVAAVNAFAPTADGGLVVGLQADGPVDFGDGPISTVAPPLVGLLARLASDGSLSWLREVTGAQSFDAVGEDGAGHIIAVTTGGGDAAWGDLAINGDGDASAEFTACFDADGTALWGTVTTGFDSYSRALVSPYPGVLLSGGVVGPLALGGADVPYGDLGGYDETGVVVRLNGAGNLDSFLALGLGSYSVAPGPNRMFAGAPASVNKPLGLVWCAGGAEPCDRYGLPETEAQSLVAVMGTGSAAFMAGQMRLTPGGSLANRQQLYLMKLAP